MPQDHHGFPFSPLPPKTDPKQHLRKTGYFYSLLPGHLLHFVFPPLIEVPENRTLAEPGMWRMTRGARELQLHHPTSISSSSAQPLLTGNHNQALNSGPRGFIDNTPKYSKHPQPKPTSNSHLLNNFIQNHCPSELGGQAECQCCANTDVLG